MQITINFGIESIAKSYTIPPTFGEVLRDQSIRAVLGYGDNVRPLVFGVEQPLTNVVADGTTVTVETRPNQKQMA